MGGLINICVFVSAISYLLLILSAKVSGVPWSRCLPSHVYTQHIVFCSFHNYVYVLSTYCFSSAMCLGIVYILFFSHLCVYVLATLCIFSPLSIGCVLFYSHLCVYVSAMFCLSSHLCLGIGCVLSILTSVCRYLLRIVSSHLCI